MRDRHAYYPNALLVVSPNGTAYRGVTEEDLKAAIGTNPGENYGPIIVQVDTAGLPYRSIDDGLAERIYVFAVRREDSPDDVVFGMESDQLAHVVSVDHATNTTWAETEAARPRYVYLVELGTFRPR
jgi:hypothetical protein